MGVESTLPSSEKGVDLADNRPFASSIASDGYGRECEPFAM